MESVIFKKPTVIKKQINELIDIKAAYGWLAKNLAE